MIGKAYYAFTNIIHRFLDTNNSTEEAVFPAKTFSKSFGRDYRFFCHRYTHNGSTQRAAQWLEFIVSIGHIDVGNK